MTSRPRVSARTDWGFVALFVVVLLLIVPARFAAAANNPVVDYVLPANETSVAIPCSTIPGCSLASTSIPSKNPDHGTLATTLTGWLYTPDNTFWSVGTDSFTLPIGFNETATIQIIAGRHQDFVQFLDFETLSAGLPPESIIGYINRLVVTPAAAIHGSYGLQIGLGDITDVGFAIDIEPNTTGGYPTGSSAIIVIDICSAEGTSPLQEATMLRALDPLGYPIYELRYAPFEQKIWAVAFANGFEAWTSDPVFLGPGAHKIDFDWWAAPGPFMDDGGLMFLVDDMIEGRVESLGNAGDSFYQLDPGNFDASAGITGTYHLDDVWVAVGAIGPRTQTFVRDGFEGDLSLWSDIYDPTSQLDVSTTSAVTGVSSLAFQLKGSQPAWIENNDPSGQRSFGVRFSIHSSNLSVESNAGVIAALLGVRNDLASSNHLVLRSRFGGFSKGYEIQLVIRQDDGTWATHPWANLDFKPHSVGVQFLGAMDSTSADGVARLWIDGKVVGEMTNLDTDTKRMGTMRFGVFNRNGALDGTLQLDNFESWGN